jgi:hypothetical protein
LTGVKLANMTVRKTPPSLQEKMQPAAAALLINNDHEGPMTKRWLFMQST